MEQKQLSQLRAITISREYGSGGGEIARRLANRLDWTLLDHQVVAQVARKAGIGVSEAEVYDERSEGLLTRWLSTTQYLFPGAPQTPVILPDRENIFREALNELLVSTVEIGKVVIVGRASQIVLHEYRNVFHARIIAPMDQRVEYVMQREGLSQQDAKSRIHQKEQDRQRYLRDQYHHEPNDPQLYDLITNTGSLGLEGAVDLILQAVQQKERYYLAEQKPTLVGGLSRYPWQADSLYWNANEQANRQNPDAKNV